ncbi:c-type cytochrome [Pontivivens nitratireducens]|uniref:c-type cytochrome n=1 Tax=Pontivivens nitratireducens TaxID=2758038 RepID=UPI00163AF721|nr:c-type cytochrome [Pontibrevibacter nitratireducens]
MDSLELNKIIAGVLGAVLTLLLFSWVGDLVYGLGEGGHDEAHLAYEIALPEGDAEVAEVEKGPSIGELLVTASAENGEGLFRACAACHTATEEANKVGPYLLNVIGRDIAAVDGFTYSDALLTIDGVWTAENFSHFIESPRGWAPGTKMGYNGMSRAGDRADIIAYLVEASGQTLEDFIVLPEEEPATEDAAIEDTATEDAVVEGEETLEETTAIEEAPTEEAPVEEEPEEAVEDTADSTTDSLVEPAEQMIEGVDAIDGEAAVEDDATVEGEEAAEATDTDLTNDAEVISVPTVIEEQLESIETEPAPVEGVAPVEQETAPAVDAIEEEEAATPTDPAPARETAPVETAPIEAAPVETAPIESGAADMPAFMANASAEDGERAFRACRACHVVEEGVNRVGPSLYGVIDRDIGSVEDFNYSSAMAEKDGTWTYENLDAYLTAPRTWLPGTKMAYAGMRREQDRANVIAYLEAASQ